MSLFLTLYNIGLGVCFLVSIPTFILYIIEAFVLRSKSYSFRNSPYHILFYAANLVDIVMFPANIFWYKLSYWWVALFEIGMTSDPYNDITYFFLGYPSCVITANLLFVAINRLTAVMLPVQHNRIWERFVYWSILLSFLLALIPTWMCLQMHVYYVFYDNGTQFAQYIDNYWFPGYLPGTWSNWYTIPLTALTVAMHFVTAVMLRRTLKSNSEAARRSERALLILSILLVVPNALGCVYQFIVSYLNETGQNDLLAPLALVLPYLIDANTLHRPWMMLFADTAFRHAVVQKTRKWFACWRISIKINVSMNTAVQSTGQSTGQSRSVRAKPSTSFMVPTLSRSVA